MAINWTRYAPNSRKVLETWTTHEGLVVGESYSREMRVMSDVYAMVGYVRVWNPETGATETVDLGAHFECNFKFGRATVDAPAELLADIAAADAKYEAEKAAAEKARWAREARERAEAAHNKPEVGKVMQVIKGRKVPQGTVGRVFWTGMGDWGPRTGLALSSAKDERGRFTNVVYVSSEYLVNTAELAA